MTMTRSQLRSAWNGVWLVVSFLAVATLGIGASGIPTLAARAWFVSGAPTQADVVVVLGGGVTWPGVLLCGSFFRLRHAISLYERGYADRLILTGGTNPEHPAVSAEAVLMRESALKMGVPQEAIVVEPRASRTYENALEVAAIMRREGWRSALLVTDALHMRRALLVFQRLGVGTYPAPSPAPWLAARTPAEGLTVLEKLGYEIVATIVYKLRGWL